VDDEEVFKFSELSSQFWDINGPFHALHLMNRVRVPLIRDALLQNAKGKIDSKPLKYKNILDIGCGGGILCEVNQKGLVY
jgi:2-polyprenyl-3-methyl-5-hydroxy-6-metoxy-1,4-benzoquinol methylase